MGGAMSASRNRAKPFSGLAVLAVACVVAGCGGGGSGDYGASSPEYAARIDLPPSESASSLERQHFVTIDVPQDQVEPSFDAAVAACSGDPKLECTLLDSALNKGEDSTASLTVRVAPAGVEPFIALAAKDGNIESRSSQTNDLAQPIVDVEQKLAMLDAYKADLLRLRVQSSNNVDALIKVASEIAKTQAEIDSLKGEHVQLRKRVDLQRVAISFHSNRQQSVATPIGRALRDFGRNLTSGIAEAITGFAHLLPWLLLLVPVLLLIRHLWRRFR